VAETSEEGKKKPNSGKSLKVAAEKETTRSSGGEGRYLGN